LGLAPPRTGSVSGINKRRVRIGPLIRTPRSIHHHCVTRSRDQILMECANVNALELHDLQNGVPPECPNAA
jgi:hypothetical protein